MSGQVTTPLNSACVTHVCVHVQEDADMCSAVCKDILEKWSEECEKCRIKKDGESECRGITRFMSDCLTMCII